MIGYLKGIIKEISGSKIILLCQNIGYEILVPVKLLVNYSVGDEAEFYIYTHVREDQLKLFGFEDNKEKQIFEIMIGVSGVGPKIGLLILSAASVGQIQKAISTADVAFFTNIKGLGKKGAQKIIIELKNKLGSLAELDLSDSEVQVSNDVVEALITFGFKRRDILPVLAKIDSKLEESEQIKMALNELGK
jgi:holliday junction DNA helicase RuvA